MKLVSITSIFCLLCGIVFGEVFEVPLFDSESHSPNLAIYLGTGDACSVAAKVAGEDAIKTRDSKKCLIVENSANVVDCSRIVAEHVWPLPDFFDSEIFVDVYVPINPISNTISLWIEDADGEVFRFDKNLPNSNLGWQKLRYLVHSEHPKGEVVESGKSPDGLISLPARLLGFGFDKIEDGEGELAFKTVTMRLNTMPLSPELFTGVGTPVGVLRPGEEDGLGFRLFNNTGKDAQVLMKWKLFAFDGRLLEDMKRFTGIPKGATAFMHIRNPEKFGVYRLKMQFHNLTTNRKMTHSFSFAYMKPVGPTPISSKKFSFGVNTTVAGKNEFDLWLEAVAAAWCGANKVRALMSWEEFQPDEKEWNIEAADMLCSKFKEQGIETDLAVAYTPAWAVDEAIAGMTYTAGNILPHRRMPDLEQWQIFIKKLVQRYQRKITSLEIWNGADLFVNADFSAENYVRLLQAAYDIAKRINSRLQVRPSAFSCQPESFGARYNGETLKAVVANGKYDELAIQGRGWSDELSDQIQMVKDAGNTKSVQVAAATVSSAGGNENIQAIELFRKGVLSMVQGAKGFYWYSLYDSGDDYQAPNQNLGLMTNQGYPKPAFAAFNTLVSLFDKSTFVEKVQFGQECTGYVFQNQRGEMLVAIWSDTGRIHVPIFAMNLVGTPEVYDIYANVTKPEVNFGSTTFEAGGSPVVLKARFNGGKATLFGPLVRPLSEFKVVPGKQGLLEFNLVNPLADETLEYSFAMEFPEYLKPIDDVPEMVVLGPGHSKTVRLAVEADGTFFSSAEAPKTVTMILGSKLDLKCRVDYPVVAAVQVPANNYPETPQFQMNSAKLVNEMIALVDDDVEAGAEDADAEFWKGPEDLSGQVRLCFARSTLFAKVSVTDDVKIAGGEDGIGDSVYCVLQLPDQFQPWVIAVTSSKFGKPSVNILECPEGFSLKDTYGITVKAEPIPRDKDNIEYVIGIPLGHLGMSNIAGRSISFNTMLLDDDGNGAKSFMSSVPGFNLETINIDELPRLVLPAE